MNLKTIFITVIYFIFTLNSFCNEYFNMNVGDTIIPYDKGNYMIRIYFFIKPETCECIKLLSTLHKDTNNSDKEILCFLSGSNDKLSQEFKKKYNVDFEVIPDKINSYHEFYKVKRINVMLICDNDGKVLFSSEINNESFSKINDYISQINEKKIDDNNPQFELLKTEIIDFEDKPFFMNSGYLSIFKTSIEQKPFVFIKDDIIYIINESGKIIDSYLLNSPNEDKYNYYLPASTCSADSMLFINAFMYSNSFYKIKRKLIFFDINNHKICTNLNYDKVGDSIILKSNIIYPLFENKRLLCVNDLHFYDVNNKTNPLIIVDTSNIFESILNFGYVDSIFTSPAIKRDYRIYYSTDGITHFIINQYSDILQVYDENFNKLNYVRLNFKHFNKHDENNLPLNKTFAEANKYSFIKGNFYNKERQLKLIVYENRIIPDGIMSVFSPKSKLNFYGHLVDNEFKALLNYDIAFPERNIPFHFEDDIIYCYLIQDNKLKINKFKIKNLNAITGR